MNPLIELNLFINELRFKRGLPGSVKHALPLETEQEKRWVRCRGRTTRSEELGPSFYDGDACGSCIPIGGVILGQWRGGLDLRTAGTSMGRGSSSTRGSDLRTSCRAKRGTTSVTSRHCN